MDTRLLEGSDLLEFSGTYRVSLQNCSVPLPFICRKNIIVPTIKIGRLSLLLGFSFAIKHNHISIWLEVMICLQYTMYNNWYVYKTKYRLFLVKKGVVQCPILLHSSFSASFCDEQWLGNMYIPHCFRIFKELLPFPDAQTTCANHDGKLAPVFTQFDQVMIQNVIQFYEQSDECTLM